MKKLFERGIKLGIASDHVDRLKRILALLETATSIGDMDLPGLHLHELKGKRKGTWSVRISGSWRVTFKLADGDVFSVDYEDYH